MSTSRGSWGICGSVPAGEVRAADGQSRAAARISPAVTTSPRHLGKIHPLSKSPDSPQTHFAAMSKMFDSGPGNWVPEGPSPAAASPGVPNLRKGADVLAPAQRGGC